jgi:hypothetical protein
VVRQEAVHIVRGGSPRSIPEVARQATQRLGLGALLRRVGDSGEQVAIHLVDGSRHDGVLERVGEDFVELRDGTGRTDLVALASLAAVSSRDAHL